MKVFFLLEGLGEGYDLVHTTKYRPPIPH